ncbi:hypothetical protein MAR_007551, partial [Mya arenaria]
MGRITASFLLAANCGKGYRFFSSQKNYGKGYRFLSSHSKILGRVTASFLLTAKLWKGLLLPSFSQQNSGKGYGFLPTHSKIMGRVTASFFLTAKFWEGLRLPSYSQQNYGKGYRFLPSHSKIMGRVTASFFLTAKLWEGLLLPSFSQQNYGKGYRFLPTHSKIMKRVAASFPLTAKLWEGLRLPSYSQPNYGKGCLFSNAICETGTPCIDDLLFGTCGGDEVPASFAFTLNTHDLTKLQEEIGKLVAKGLTWRDGYTQCIVQNVIVSLSTLEPFSKKVCYPLIFDITDPTINEITSALDQLYNAQNRLENLEPVYELEQVPLIGNSEKRDEIVKVHKYFDKNEKIHKRFWDENSYNVDPFTSYMNYPPDDTYPDSYTQTAPSLDPGLTYWENTGIPYEDLKLVQQYLETTRQRDPYKSKLSELFNLEYGGFKPVDSYVYAKNYAEPNYEIREPEMMPGYAWTNDDDIHKQKQSDKTDGKRHMPVPHIDK